MTAGRLPDVVLLEILDFLLAQGHCVDDWHKLVHVCRRWRNVVFSSPRRLNLQLFCRPGRPATQIFSIWPKLPILVSYDGPPTNTDDVIAALKHKGFVSEIELAVSPGSAGWEKFATVMQCPFPMLEDLTVRSYHDMTLVISDSFLGGSAPRLERLFLYGIVFPALPNLLLSATDLVELSLWEIPHSGYISPEVMVTCTSGLTRLQSLSLRFQSPRSCPDGAGRFLPSSAHTLLPALTYLDFNGVAEYLEDLVARIDAPLLKSTQITLFNQLVFDILQFPNLVRRTEKFQVLDQADVILECSFVNIRFSQKGATTDSTKLGLEISCSELDWQLSALAQVYNLCSPTLPSLECLSIRDSQDEPPRWQDDMENTQWLELLYPFATVKNLYLSEEVALYVASALQELSDERVTEVLPALQDVFIDGLQPSGPVREVFQKFVAARGRQVSGHPVTIHSWVGGEGR